MKRFIFAAGLLACTTLASFAWGKLGHQVIATSAVAKLDPAAKSAVLNILANSETHEISAPTNAATWPDDIKPGHSLSGTAATKAFNTKNPHNDNWHFANYPLEGTYTLTGEFSAKSDVVHAINHCIDVLEHKSGATNMSDAQTLAFLIHLVGDLHQPLHVGCGYYELGAQNVVELVRDPGHASGLPHDVGGNKLVWGHPGRFQPEFHALWDDTLVNANSSVSRTLNQKIASNWNNVHLATRPPDYHHWAESWANDSIALANRVYVDASGLEGTQSVDHKHNNEKIVTIDIEDR